MIKEIIGIIFLIIIDIVVFISAYNYNKESHEKAKDDVDIDIVFSDGIILSIIFTILYNIFIRPIVWVIRQIRLALPYWVTKILLYLLGLVIIGVIGIILSQL